MGLVFGIPNPKMIGNISSYKCNTMASLYHLIGTNQPFLGNFICADADPSDGSHWVIYYWAAILVVEGTLLSLALVKAWQHRRAAHGSSIMQQLTKDSVIYFAT
jgi:hypothetical protein